MRINCLFRVLVQCCVHQPYSIIHTDANVVDLLCNVVRPLPLHINAQRSAEQFDDNKTKTETVQLTKQVVMENVEEQEITQTLPTGDPYPQKTPKDMLERQFLITTLELSDSTATTSFYPHLLLREIKTNSIYLTRFRYFRSAIKLKFLMVSNQMQYGLISISFIPYTNYTSLAKWTKMSQRSQANMHLLDVSEQEGLEVDLPYLSPKLFWDLDAWSNETRGWRVDVSPIALSTVSLGASDRVFLKVFASFDRPECAGYIPEPLAQFQSGRTLDRRSRAMNFAGVAQGTLATVARQGTQWLSNIARGQAPAAAAVASPAIGGALYEAVKAVKQAPKIKTKPEVEKPSKPVKMEVCPDLSSPSAGVSLPALGDTAAKDFSCLPQINNEYDINKICQVPTYQNVWAISSVGPVDSLITISCDPFLKDSYASYFKPMFKYFRGSSRVMIRFSTSPLVSGRIKITLFPVTNAGANVNTEGDLPSWILTVKGPTTWCLEIPYLQVNPWSECGDTTLTFPTLRVELLDELPQPFDKQVSIFATAFVSTGSDFQFAGLQSCVPGPTATFQCSIVSEMAKCEKIGTTFDFPYQGGLMQVQDALSRYSSRDAIPSNLFPFPIRITDKNHLTQLDNFDYICNLYKFYTGDINVRLLFSKGSATTLLRAGVSNSNTVVNGRQWRSGNSMAVTDQTVWPMLEYTYPYLNTQEFDSLWEPNGMFAQTIENTAELDTMFLSASKDFKPFFLLPVPDFFVEEEQPAIFQSIRPRFVGNHCTSGVLKPAPGAVTNANAVASYNYDLTACFSLEVAITRTAGNADFVVNVAAGNVAPPIPDGSNKQSWSNPILAGSLRWSDPENTGKNTVRHTFTGVFSHLGGSPGPLNIYAALQNVAGVAVDVDYCFRIMPWSTAVIPSSPSIASDSVVVTNSTLVGSTVTQSVNVANSLDVVVTNEPTVKLNSPVTIQGPLTVSGSSAPDILPVWTSLYKPS